MCASLDSLAAQYESYRQSIGGISLSEPPGEGERFRLPEEQAMQLFWLAGEFGNEWTDDRGCKVKIIRHGRWNRGAGPDFLDALVEIDGQQVSGDIELDPCPEDWERHGHGANPEFGRVVLHLACLPSKQAWFTRNCRHERIPLAVLPAELVLPLCRGGDAKAAANLIHPSCRASFESMNGESIDKFLQSVAACRLKGKREQWENRCRVSGRDQVLYECLAETLGYSGNKMAMRHLARRAPLADIRSCPEAILFGTAGFLVPVLKETCDLETRSYHKDLWDCWWKRREHFELSDERRFHWKGGNIRPSNHPQRRLAALALLAAEWERFSRLCMPSKWKALVKLMTALEHPYWSCHVTLPSPRSEKPMALIGRERALDFVINHVMAMEGVEEKWEDYLALPGSTVSSRVLETARALLGDDQLAAKWTKKAYQQQAFLQIHHDFCGSGCIANCPLPGQVSQWNH